MKLRKRFFHNLMNMILSIIIVVSLTACGGNEPANEEVNSTVETNVKKNEEATESEGPKDQETSIDYDQLADSGLPPISIGLTKFMDMKGVSYEMLNPVMDQVSEDNPMAGLAFLPLIDGDLIVLPLTMIAALPAAGGGVWEGNLLILYEGTGRVEVNGDISTFSMEVVSQNEADKSMQISGEYDSKSDSMTAIFTMDDGSETIFEFVASGNGYVSQLYTENESGASIIKSAFEEGKLYTSLISIDGKPGSIYQRDISDWKKFIASDELMVVIDQSKGFTIIDGKKYEY